MKRIPIGVDDFAKLIDVDRNFLFVDKSLLIKELIDNGAEVSLIIRPRRWGKTLNMSMLKYFFAKEVKGIPTQGKFDNLKIAKAQDGYYLKQQGKYPVIFISFKDLKQDNFDNFIDNLKILIQEICQEYPQLEVSELLSASEKDNFKKLLFKTVNRAELARSLKSLSMMLAKHFGSKVIILIDEYDTPLNAAFDKPHFDDIVEFFKTLLGAALKSNDALEKSVITGILRLSKNKMLSDINNLSLYSFTEKAYSSSFGFAEDEIVNLFATKQVNLDLKAIKYWYNGYRSGDLVGIYNPWSILNCLQNAGDLKPYWIKTGDESLLKTIFKNLPKAMEDKIVHLLENGSIEASIDEYISFDQIISSNEHINNYNEEIFWSLLWATGYLTFKDHPPTISAIGSYIGLLSIPNYEVACSYRAVFPKWPRALNRAKYDAFLNHLVLGNVDAFISDLKDYLLTVPSYFDFPKESNYHSFLLGLTASLQETHQVYSNKEVGYGRPDMLLIPKNYTNSLGIILEFKKESVGKDINTYKSIATNGLNQIEIQQYTAIFQQTHHIQQILKLCVVFYGKQLLHAYVIEKFN